MVYDINGNALSSIYDIDGSLLGQAYGIDGSLIYDGENRKPIKKYNYSSDEDPEKSYRWTYDLTTLQILQGNCFTIGVQTDTHYWQPTHGLDYVTPMKNMTKQLYFDFITNMGDIPRGWGSDTETPAYTLAAEEETIRRYTDYVESPVLIVRGNHDNGMYHHGTGHPQTLDSSISKADLYDAIIGGTKRTTSIVEGGNGDFYYYKDFSECRVIVLDTNDYPFLEISDYDVHGNHHTISQAQVTWFENVALNTDKPVLIISHCPIVTGLTASGMVVPDEDKGYMDRNTIAYRADAIVSAIDNFRLNGGDVVACLHGHVHQQRNRILNDVNYIAFGNGGYYTEIVFVDFENRTITTKVLGANLTCDAGTVVNRNFTF